MVRILQIAGVLAVILAVVLFVLPAVSPARRGADSKIEELLRAPGAVEAFSAARGQAQSDKENQISPLVKEAADLGHYLNPPPPPKPVSMPTAAPGGSGPEQPAPSGPVSAKFNLIGTSYFASHPEQSLALIDEPGKGLQWIRQGGTVNRLVIEKVSDGSITIRDGQRTFEMNVVKVDEKWRGLVKGAGGTTTEAATKPLEPAAVTNQPEAAKRITRGQRGIGGDRQVRPDVAAIRQRSGGTVATQEPPVRQPTPAPVTQNPESAVSESPPARQGAADVVSPPDEKDFIRLRLAEEISASRITTDEAKRMEELAQTLEQLEELVRQKAAGQFDANASSAGKDSAKSKANPSEPNHPPVSPRRPTPQK